jgi:hypothetical protein
LKDKTVLVRVRMDAIIAVKESTLHYLSKIFWFVRLVPACCCVIPVCIFGEPAPVELQKSQKYHLASLEIETGN